MYNKDGWFHIQLVVVSGSGTTVSFCARRCATTMDTNAQHTTHDENMTTQRFESHHYGAAHVPAPINRSLSRVNRRAAAAPGVARPAAALPATTPPRYALRTAWTASGAWFPAGASTAPIGPCWWHEAAHGVYTGAASMVLSATRLSAKGRLGSTQTLRRAHRDDS